MNMLRTFGIMIIPLLDTMEKGTVIRIKNGTLLESVKAEKEYVTAIRR